MWSIEDYDRAEARALQTINWAAVRAFTPTTFLRDGTPTRAASERELARYVDMMGEIRAFDGWDKARFSDSEVTDIMWLRNHVQWLTRSLFGESITPITNLLSPWPVLRAVRHLAKDRSLRVFEIAAGCGYLGAYLIRDGHDYTGTDVAKGLFLWQNRLWGSIGNHVHVPWWEFARHEALPSADVVVCDGALGEINWFGYAYVLHAAVKMIGEDGYFIYSNIGDHANRRSVMEDLLELGLRLVLTTPQGAQCWSRTTSSVAPMIEPTGTQLSELGLVPDQLPPNYAFLRFAGIC